MFEINSKKGRFEAVVTIHIFYSNQGTSDGSYSFVNPLDDGNKGLEKTLTDLMKATTGLVGKSVYLLLKMKNGARVLGDWFGEQDQEIVLQVIFPTACIAEFF